MALIKIYARADKKDELFEVVSTTIKYVASAALNVPEIPTSPSSVETVFVEAIDIIGIDYIIEIIAVERPNQQQIADKFIAAMNTVYPEVLFSVYFNNISIAGMANTPRVNDNEEPITIEEAIKRSKV
jgi:hypothetical protein